MCPVGTNLRGRVVTAQQRPAYSVNRRGAASNCVLSERRRTGRRRAVRRYNPDMIRTLGVSWAAFSLAFGGVCCAGIADASPSDGSRRCTFVLPPLKVVQVSGVNFVYATMAPGPCTIEANPNSSVVCVSVEGSDSTGQCATTNGPSPAVLYFSYRPGTTYVVKGQGCSSVNVPPYTICQDFPASRVTL